MDTVLAYLEYLARRLASPKSVTNYWSAVKVLHAYSKHKFVNSSGLEIDLMLKSISVSKRHVSKQKFPLSKKHLTQMCQILESQEDVGIVVKTILLFGWYGFLRASNLCPEDPKVIDHTRHFLRRDVQCTEDYLVITVKWAKNMQCSIQQQKIVLPKAYPKIVDPVSTYRKLCQMIPAKPKQPLFLLQTGLPIALGKFRTIFTLLCKQIGINPEDYSPHSLRRGGASYAKKNGATDTDIQRHGVWASAAYKDYLTAFPDEQSSVFAALAH